MQVLVAATRNWGKEMPMNSNELYEIRDKSSSQAERIRHTNQFRLHFLTWLVSYVPHVNGVCSVA